MYFQSHGDFLAGNNRKYYRHTFCNKCILKLIENSPKCPVCRQSIDEELMGLDHIANNIINEL